MSITNVALHYLGKYNKLLALCVMLMAVAAISWAASYSVHGNAVNPDPSVVVANDCISNELGCEDENESTSEDRCWGPLFRTVTKVLESGQHVSSTRNVDGSDDCTVRWSNGEALSDCEKEMLLEYVGELFVHTKCEGEYYHQPRIPIVHIDPEFCSNGKIPPGKQYMGYTIGLVYDKTCNLVWEDEAWLEYGMAIPGYRLENMRLERPLPPEYVHFEFYGPIACIQPNVTIPNAPEIARFGATYHDLITVGLDENCELVWSDGTEYEVDADLDGVYSKEQAEKVKKTYSALRKKERQTGCRVHEGEFRTSISCPDGVDYFQWLAREEPTLPSDLEGCKPLTSEPIIYGCENGYLGTG